MANGVLWVHGFHSGQIIAVLLEYEPKLLRGKVQPITSIRYGHEGQCDGPTWAEVTG